MVAADRYDLIERIAAGGMGEVFRARVSGAHGFAKTVAIKRILPELAKDPERSLRFVSEAKLAVSLNHANLVQVLDFARAGEELYLVMEYVDGVDLRRVLNTLAERAAPMPLAIGIHLAIEALKGLTYAHERTDRGAVGIVHCDISPSNLLVSYSGEVKITDFGVARALARGSATFGPIAGKLPYMAPEQRSGGSLDARTDLYGLSLVIYEALAGQHPWRSPAHATSAPYATPPGLHQLRGEVPQALSELLGSALASDPCGRPLSARAMLQSISEIARQSGPMMTAPEVGSWLHQLIPAKREGAAPAPFAAALQHLIGRNGTEGGTAAGEAPAITSFHKRGNLEGTTLWVPVAQSTSLGTRFFAWAGVIATLACVTVAGLLLANRPSPRPPVVAPATVERPPPEPAPESKLATSSPRPEAPAVGYLNVFAEPWADVIIGGKKVGTTPLRQLPLPAGNHRVQLRGLDGKGIWRTVHIRPGKTELIDAEMR